MKITIDPLRKTIIKTKDIQVDLALKKIKIENITDRIIKINPSVSGWDVIKKITMEKKEIWEIINIINLFVRRKP